jgi:pimeloyl-ACP methyl ester carboxylesterase
MTRPLPPLFVVERGGGDPVLFVHGQPGLGRDWNAVADLLGDHRLLIVDRPGYGAGGEQTLSIEGNVELLAHVLEERGAAPATVVGHSYGGGIAIMLAARRPELVSALVLVASVGRADNVSPVDHVLAAPVLGEVSSAVGLFTLGRVLPPLRQLTGSGSPRALQWLRATLPDDTYRNVCAQWRRRVWRSFVAEQRSLLRGISEVQQAVSSVRSPTTVISGAWDIVVPPAVGRWISQTIEGSEFVIVDRAGHFVPRDAPEVVAAAVRRTEARARSQRPDLDETDTGT